jgi:hypothetical protein|nr:MAG TPA: hypothetical protein [Caudoviricetes sp.]
MIKLYIEEDGDQIRLQDIIFQMYKEKEVKRRLQRR